MIEPDVISFDELEQEEAAEADPRAAEGLDTWTGEVDE